VSEERATRPSTAGALPARVRALLGLSPDRPLPRVQAVRLEPLRRSWPAAFWQARISVRAGMTLDDFLRSRLARYHAALPVPAARLPLDVRVEEGQLVVRASAEEPAPATAAKPSDPDAWLAPLVAIDGPAARQEAYAHEVRLALLEGELDQTRRHRDELQRRFAEDVAAGLVAAPSLVDATAEQLGRPSVRSGVPRAALGGFALAALVAEAWQVGLPLAAGAGVDPGAFGAELARRPAELVFASVFALGVAAGLVALASAALTHGEELLHGTEAPRRALGLGAAALGAAAAAAVVAAAVAALPAPGAAGVPGWTRALLLLSVPLAAALALRAARREADAREWEDAAALAWDRERARTLAERARRLEELGLADAAEGALAREREALLRRLRELGARAGAAARVAARTAQAERTALARLARSLVAALELDRYEFVRQASARGAMELVAQRRRVEVAAREPVTAPAARAI